MSLIRSELFFSRAELTERRTFPAKTFTAGNATLPTDQPLCTKSYQPVCTLNETATSCDCDGLASKWNITQQDFVDYNDNVNDNCTDLVPGQPVRVFQLWTRLYSGGVM